MESTKAGIVPLINHCKYRSSLDNNPVAVYCIDPEALTAKENPVDMEHMFHT